MTLKPKRRPRKPKDLRIGNEVKATAVDPGYLEITASLSLSKGPGTLWPHEARDLASWLIEYANWAESRGEK